MIPTFGRGLRVIGQLFQYSITSCLCSLPVLGLAHGWLATTRWCKGEVNLSPPSTMINLTSAPAVLKYISSVVLLFNSKTPPETPEGVSRIQNGVIPWGYPGKSVMRKNHKNLQSIKDTKCYKERSIGPATCLKVPLLVHKV